jgi:hypothetical protein
MTQPLLTTGWWFATLLIVLVIGTPSGTQAQESRWGSPDDPIVKEITAKEEIWLDADCSSQPALKDVIADDYQGTSTDGQRIDSAGALAHDATWPDRDCQLGTVKVKFFGDNLALAYGSESMMRKEADSKVSKRCLVWTDTWLRRDGKWPIVASQDNRVKCQ